MRRMLTTLGRELRAHAPFTALGTLSGLAIVLVLVLAKAQPAFSTGLFWMLHPVHVLFSALVTTATYRLHGGRGIWRTLWIGYLGSVGIATLSDCAIPFAGEWLLDMPRRDLHLGFIERWWLVNPLALAGILLGAWRPRTKVSHAIHVLLSTWASLFHMTMAMTGTPTLLTLATLSVFLFLAVWIPCCTSDIVFPLLFAPDPVASGQNRRDRRDGAVVPRVRPEVLPFVAAAWAVVAATGTLAWALGAPAGTTRATVVAAGLGATALLLFFFRDPERTAPADPAAVVAGADGRVLSVTAVREDRFLKADAVRISIFLSLADVHVNRAPIPGTVLGLHFQPGRCLAAFRERASSLNQHHSILIGGPHGRCLVNQIAGAVVRRVVCWLKPGQEVQAGERIGMMKFGSRLDVYLPASEVDVRAKPGDLVRAGQTVIAILKPPEDRNEP